MRHFQFILLAAFLSYPAFAGTTECSSPDQNLYYSHSLPDQGIAPPDPVEAKVVLRLGGSNIPTDQVHFIESSRQKIFSQYNGGGGTEVYAINARVIDPTAEAPLFSDFVICKYVVKFVP